MQIEVVTLFPELVRDAVKFGVLGRAVERGIVQLGCEDPRTHTRDVNAMGGLAKQMPKIAVVFVVAGLASLGLPGLSGFVAEFLVFLGTFSAGDEWIPFAVLGTLGIVLGAGYILWEFDGHPLRTRVLTLGFRRLWQYPDRWMVGTAERLGLRADVHETGGAKAGAAALDARLEAGLPVIAWLDPYSDPWFGL